MHYCTFFSAFISISYSKQENIDDDEDDDHMMQLHTDDGDDNELGIHISNMRVEQNEYINLHDVLKRLCIVIIYIYKRVLLINHKETKLMPKKKKNKNLKEKDF